MTTELRVPDAGCAHCKATIEGAVSAVDGVDAAELDLDSKVLRVTHDGDLDRAVLTKAVADAGYTPEPA